MLILLVFYLTLFITRTGGLICLSLFHDSIVKATGFGGDSAVARKRHTSKIMLAIESAPFALIGGAIILFFLKESPV